MIVLPGMFHQYSEHVLDENSKEPTETKFVIFEILIVTRLHHRGSKFLCQLLNHTIFLYIDNININSLHTIR